MKSWKYLNNPLLALLTFERSEIWQMLKIKKKRTYFLLFRDSNPGCLIQRQLCLPLYHNHLLIIFSGKIQSDCNFCQISLLSKVRRTSRGLGTFRISISIVINSNGILQQEMISCNFTIRLFVNFRAKVMAFQN